MRIKTIIVTLLIGIFAIGCNATHEATRIGNPPKDLPKKPEVSEVTMTQRFLADNRNWSCQFSETEICVTQFDVDNNKAEIKFLNEEEVHVVEFEIEEDGSIVPIDEEGDDDFAVRGELLEDGEVDLEIINNERDEVVAMDPVVAPDGASLEEVVEIVEEELGFGDPEAPAEGIPFGNRDSHAPSISEDGRYVVFSSLSSNLVASDNNNAYDIFLKDLDTGLVKKISESNEGSYRPVINSDGSFVTFESLEANLFDLLVYDVEMETTTAINELENGDRVHAFGEFRNTATVAGGVTVFQSASDEYSPLDNNGTQDIFVSVLGTNGAEIITLGDERSYSPYISEDGSYIAFNSDADLVENNDPNAAPTNLYIYDRMSEETKRSVIPFANQAIRIDFNIKGISETGRYILVDSAEHNIANGDINDVNDVYRYDRELDSYTLVSVTHNGMADEGSFAIGMSADGNKVVFMSRATNLTANSGINIGIYVRDIATGNTELVTLPEGLDIAAISNSAKLSSNGRYLIIETMTDIYGSQGENAFSQIYRVDITSGAIDLVSRI